MARKGTSTGRARCVVVFGQGDAAKGVITTVTARICRRGLRGRLTFRGPVTIAGKALRHLRQTVVPLVDRVVEGLGLPAARLCFEVSAANAAAASGLGRGVEVSGFSLDAPVFIACLAAVLGMLVPQDKVATGHIASLDGDIRPVGGIEAKLRAAVREAAIETFICPAVDADASYGEISADQRDRALSAAASAKRELRVMEVVGIDELIRAVFAEEEIALAAVSRGFEQAPAHWSNDASPLKRALAFLAADLEGRFWRAEEGHLLAGRPGDARRLLQAYLQRQSRRKEYAEGLGTRLRQLIQSVPRVIRRTEDLFPLAPLAHCLKACRGAREDHWPDVLNLFDAVYGRVDPQQDDIAAETTPRIERSMDRDVEVVLGKIGAKALAREIGLPIDRARAAYTLRSVTVRSYDEFLDGVRSLYLSLLRHGGSGVAPADERQIEQDALDLLERAFARKGGLKAAYGEARVPVHSGMRLVLDTLTAQHKAERQARHVHAVLKAAVDPLDFKAQVAFVQALLQRISPHLPPEIRSRPASRYAKHIEELCEAYVQSMDRLEEQFRSL